jgi:hypothetical protein
MRIIGLFLTVFLASVLTAAVPDVLTKEQNLPRLTEVSSFPENDRAAIRTVIAALTADGGKPGEYFAEFWNSSEAGVLTIHLKHESHPSVESFLAVGDSCGHCLMAYYDLKTGKVRFQGIR